MSRQAELRAAAPPWPEPREYVTDDRDKPAGEQGKLVIFPGGNGDWYVATMPAGDRFSRYAVRLCTSGGASSSVPGLTVAISRAYRALGGEDVADGSASAELDPDAAILPVDEEPAKPRFARHLLEALRDRLIALERDATEKGTLSVVDTLAVIATLQAVLDGTAPFDSLQADQLRRAGSASGAISYGTFDLRWWRADSPEPERAR